MTHPLVEKNSLAGVDPNDKSGLAFLARETTRLGTHKIMDQRAGNEKDIPGFSMKGRNFSNSVWDVLSVLAILRIWSSGSGLARIHGGRGTNVEKSLYP